jgi:hypothetical protein
MPVSYEKLKEMLDVDEPNYAALAEIAADAMGHVRRLAASKDVALASKAVSLAGMIGDESSVAVVRDAAKSREPLLRVAAAHAASLLPASPEAARVVNKLLGDSDVGVVKTATRAADRQADPALSAKARRANARLATAVRKAAAEHTRQERAATMATRARKRAAGGRGKKTSAKRAAGGMPTGAMTEPPKGAKARKMPTGKMR